MKMHASVHVAAQDELDYVRPDAPVIPSGYLRIGELTLFPPRDRADAVEFYARLMDAAADALSACGVTLVRVELVDQGCVR